MEIEEPATVSEFESDVWAFDPLMSAVQANKTMSEATSTKGPHELRVGGGRFRVERQKIGSGSFGDIYLGGSFLVKSGPVIPSDQVWI